MKTFYTSQCFINTLHDDNLYPLHPQHVQNLHPGDSAMHPEFCHFFTCDHQLLPLILFSDEVTFTHNTINITHNLHWWSHDNPHGSVETNFQHRFSTSVWCGMTDDMLIGPAILDNCMKGHNYLDFLQNRLPEQLEMFLWLQNYYVRLAWWSPFLLYLTCDAASQWHIPLSVDQSWQ
jgi:hypothetical protein